MVCMGLEKLIPGSSMVAVDACDTGLLLQLSFLPMKQCLTLAPLDVLGGLSQLLLSQEEQSDRHRLGGSFLPSLWGSLV